MTKRKGNILRLMCQSSNGHNLGTRVLAYLKKCKEVFVLNLGRLLEDTDERIDMAGYGHRLEFPAGAMEKITGISRPRLASWQKQGICQPSIERAEGTGTTNIYTRSDLYSIMLAERLIENGWGKRGGYDFMRLRVNDALFDIPRDDRYLIFYHSK